MEKIDIIELLQRVKEGRAPKEIEIGDTKYEFMENYSDIYYIYQSGKNDSWMVCEGITLDTKIKILDKPIIEELKPIKEIQGIGEDSYEIERIPNDGELMEKINEIIKWINKENKDE